MRHCQCTGWFKTSPNLQRMSLLFSRPVPFRGVRMATQGFALDLHTKFFRTCQRSWTCGVLLWFCVGPDLTRTSMDHPGLVLGWAWPLGLPGSGPGWNLTWRSPSWATLGPIWGAIKLALLPFPGGDGAQEFCCTASSQVRPDLEVLHHTCTDTLHLVIARTLQITETAGSKSLGTGYLNCGLHFNVCI